MDEIETSPGTGTSVPGTEADHGVDEVEVAAAIGMSQGGRLTTMIEVHLRAVDLARSKDRWTAGIYY